MYKTAKLVALASVFALVLLGSLAYAEETDMGYYDIYEPGRPFDSAWGTGYGQETPGPMAMQPAGDNWLEASSLIGHQVFGAGSDDLGMVSDYVIDHTHGRIALVILSDVPGYGAKKVAIPYSFLTRTEGGTFTINFLRAVPVLAFRSDFEKPYAEALAPGEIRGDIDGSFVDSVYARFGAAPYWTESGMGTKFECYTYTRLLGDHLGLASGGMAGRVDDFVFDFSDGHVALLALTDVPARGDSRVAVPYTLLSRHDDNMFALNISDDKLASAPTFNEGADASNRAYAESVYRYYGVQPYWTEDGMMDN